MFQGFPEADLAAISGLFAPVSVGPDGVLFEIGAPAQDLYVLATGAATLEAPADETFALHPPALIGELGALTTIARSTRAIIAPGSQVFGLSAKVLQRYFNENQELGLRFLVNLLSIVAEKVQRDQVRLSDMRKNLVGTQKELKRLRELVLETVETPLSRPVHDTLEKLITNNRRVNYRVNPPSSMAATLRLDAGDAPLVDISRTHSTFVVPEPAPAVGSWMSGVLVLAGVELPISGTVLRVRGRHVTLTHDLLMDEYARALEGYLTRVQLLDVLV